MKKIGLRKTFVALAALVSVVIIAYFYFLVLVPDKESELNSRGLRILAQIEQNILDKKANAQKTLDDVYSTQYNESTGKFKSFFSFFKGLSVDPDSVLRNRERTGNKYGNFNPIYNAATDKWQLQFFGEYGQDNWLAYRYDLDDFLRDVLFYRDDFFEDYIVLHNGKVIYQTSSLAYAGFKIGAVDSVNKKSNRYSGKFLLGDHVKRDTLGGKTRFVFVHPFNHATDLNIVLCGIISTEKYNSEKYLLNTTEIIWVTLIFVLVAFSLPIIKLVTVSEFERLSQYDVLRIGIALTAGSSVLSVCLLLWTHNASQYNRQAGVTQQVARSLENRMMGELEEISRQWDCQVEMLCADSLYVRWIRDSIREVSTSLNRSDFHHQVETFVLLNEKGQGVVFDMRENGLITQLELNERDYFKAFQKKNLDISPYLGKDSTTTFYLQPIYSWLDQQNTVVMSKALDSGVSKKIGKLLDKNRKIKDFGPPVIFGLETHMFSIIKPALLSDVSFCILDKSGKVLFHSDEKRNLRENFIEETGNDPLIRELIANHVETTLQVQYYGGEHVTHFRPMEYLPYTIVVLYDTSFFMEALSNQATFTLLMLITLGLMLTLIIVVVYFVTSPSNILRCQRLGIKWLYFNTSNRTAFVNLFCWLWLPVLLSIVFMKGENVFFLSFFLPLFTLALSAGVVYDANMDNYKAGFYENYVKWQYHVFLWICAGLGFLFLAIVFRAGVSVFSGLVFISVEATMIGLAIKPDILPMLRIKWNDIPGNHPDGRGWGKYMAVPACLLLLFNFSFFPALNFFSLSVRQEREIKQKRNSLELAEGIDAREHWLLSKNTNRPILDLLRTGIYMPGGKEAVTKLRFNQRPSVAVVPERNEFLSLYNRIVNIPNISYSNSELKTSFHDFNIGKSAERRWKWILPDTLDYRYRHNPFTDSLTFVPIVLPGGKTIIQCLTVEDWSKIMIGVTVSLVLLSVILAFVHKKITLFEYFSSGPEQRKVRRAEKKYIRSSIQYNAKNLLILSLRGSGVTKYIKKFCIRKDGTGEKALDALSKANIEYQYLECVNSKHNHSIVLLPYFELKDSDSSLLCKQLSALNECFKSQELKVVWIAASDPCEQVLLLGKRSLALMKGKDEENSKGQKEEKNENDKKPVSASDADKLKQERNDILGILNDFEKVTYSLEDNLTRSRTDGASYFIEEFEFGSYLQDLGAEVTGKWGVENSPILNTYFKYKRKKPQSSFGQQWSWQIRFSQAEEHFILKIQDMAQNYYYSVWAGLSTREKYVLYDFASDEITNYRNFGILSALVRKGLLYYDDRVGALRVMSRSFRNFILTVVDKNEALQLEKEINISGTWETLRIVLVIFLIAIAIFLFATEKTTFNRVIGFITAIASIGPLLIAFVSNLKGLSFGK